MSRYRRGVRRLGAGLIAAVMFVACGLLLPVSAAAASTSLPCGPRPVLNANNFPAVPNVNNKFNPLVPGMQFSLNGVVLNNKGQPIPHQVLTTVTNLTKEMTGVNAIVIYDLDFQNGVLLEAELFFVAQDKQGTVWLLGEYPEEYKHGTLTGAPSSWISGVQRAHAGIIMLANPRVGSPVYIQGLARPVGMFDCASVFATNQRVCVPARCFDDVMVTDEFSPLDLAGGHQRKFYAPGVGNVNVTAPSGTNPETLHLTRFGLLCPAAFAKVIDDVLEQDARGYSVATVPYSTTTPAAATLTAKAC